MNIPTTTTIASLKQYMEEYSEVSAQYASENQYARDVAYTNTPKSARARRDATAIGKRLDAMAPGLFGSKRIAADQILNFSESDSETIQDVLDRNNWN